MKGKTKINKIEKRMAKLDHLKDFKIEEIFLGKLKISFTYTKNKNISYAPSVDDFIKINIERLENDVKFLKGLLK
jgi:hypothetical protein